MDTSLTLLIQISIVAIAGIYFTRTENKIVKGSIGLFGLAMVGVLLSRFTGIQSIGTIAYGVIYFASILLFVIHIFKSKNITLVNKGLLVMITLFVVISFVSQVQQFPGYGQIRLFTILPIGLIFFLNAAKLNELREELRVLDLFGIIMLIDLITFIYSQNQ